jgi:hypothetical protein
MTYNKAMVKLPYEAGEVRPVPFASIPPPPVDPQFPAARLQAADDRDMAQPRGPRMTAGGSAGREIVMALKNPGHATSSPSCQNENEGSFLVVSALAPTPEIPTVGPLFRERWRRMAAALATADLAVTGEWGRLMKAGIGTSSPTYRAAAVDRDCRGSRLQPRGTMSTALYSAWR